MTRDEFDFAFKATVHNTEGFSQHQLDKANARAFELLRGWTIWEDNCWSFAKHIRNKVLDEVMASSFQGGN